MPLAVSRRLQLPISLVLVVLIVLAILVSLWPPVVADASDVKSVQLGYFWQPPTDGTSVQKLATTAGIATVAQGKEGYGKQLREAGFTGKLLQYMQLGAVDGPGPYANASAPCNATYEPLGNQLVDAVGAFCRDVHPNESWFLHNGKGQRLYHADSNGTKYYMNLANPGWRAYAKQRLVADFTSLGYDGFFFDNLDLSMFRLQRLTNSDGVVREITSDSAYREAYIGYLAVLSEAVRPAGVFWGNMTSDPHTGSSWNAYLQYLDGGMYEAFATGYDKPLSTSKWNGDLTQAEWALANGKGILGVSQGLKGDTKKQTFGLASYLLVTNGTNAYFRYAKAAQYGEWWQYGNYDVSLGQPTGKRYQVGTAWRRDFACGYVTADPTTQTGKIVTQSCNVSTPTPEPTPSPTPEPSPAESRQALPGRIEAEDYRAGGEGVGYHDLKAGNSGGVYRDEDVDIQTCKDAASPESCYNVGWIREGEWLAYDVVVATEGNYTVTVRVAALESGKRLHLELNGANVSGTLTIPATGSWQTWGDVTTTVRLPAGEHTLAVVAETHAFNLNFLEVQPAQ